jgi:hypothetical protein
MYVSLHVLAIDLAEQSGKLAGTDNTQAQRLLFL